MYEIGSPTLTDIQKELAVALDPKTAIKVIDNPLQKPGHHEIVRVSIFPSPDNPAASGGDRRIILEARDLDLLKQVAASSLTNRVVVHHVGFRVETRRAPDGHLYEIWKLTGSRAVPERSLADEMIAGTDGNHVKAHR